MTSSQARRLSTVGQALMLGGLVWGVRRAHPSLYAPALCFAAGAVAYSVGRRALPQQRIVQSGVGRIPRSGEVIDVEWQDVTARA